jgi:hypothetical protein
MRKMGERKKVKSCVKLVGMGVSFRLCVWNVMWAKAGTERGEAVRKRLEEAGFDVICLTEGVVGGNRRPRLKPGGIQGSCGLLPEGGYVIDSDPDYGYRMIEGRRKVLLWSRRPWREVDRVGDPGMPGGRFVSGVTETPAGDVRVVGVCIPWDWAHVKTGRKDRERWEDHLRYLGGLERYLRGFDGEQRGGGWELPDAAGEAAPFTLTQGPGQARHSWDAAIARARWETRRRAGGEKRESGREEQIAAGTGIAWGIPVVLAGDFNQTIPRTRARVDVYEALMQALRGWDVATAGLGGIDHVALSGGLRALRVESWEAEYGGGKRVSDHAGVTVEVGWGESMGAVSVQGSRASS